MRVTISCHLEILFVTVFFFTQGIRLVLFTNNFKIIISYKKLSEVEEEIDHKFGVEDHEFMEEPGDAVQELEMHKENDAPKQLAVRVNKTKQDVELMAVEFLATRLE